MQKQQAKTLDLNKRALATITNNFANIDAQMKRALQTAQDVLKGTKRAAETAKQESMRAALAPARTGVIAEKKKHSGPSKGQTKRKKRKAADDDEWVPSNEDDSEGEAGVNPGAKRTTRARAPGRPANGQQSEPAAQETASRKETVTGGLGAAAPPGAAAPDTASNQTADAPVDPPTQAQRRKEKAAGGSAARAAAPGRAAPVPKPRKKAAFPRVKKREREPSSLCLPFCLASVILCLSSLPSTQTELPDSPPLHWLDLLHPV
jgi:hypothetical protein